MLTFITAVTAGFLVYQFMFSVTEKMKTAFPTHALQLESVDINNTCITISVRNYASVNVQITEAYVNGEKHALIENTVISPGGTGTMHLNGVYVEGKLYTLKVTPSLGSPLKIVVKYD